MDDAIQKSKHIVESTIHKPRLGKMAYFTIIYRNVVYVGRGRIIGIYGPVINIRVDEDSELPFEDIPDHWKPFTPQAVANNTESAPENTDDISPWNLWTLMVQKPRIIGVARRYVLTWDEGPVVKNLSIPSPVGNIIKLSPTRGGVIVDCIYVSVGDIKEKKTFAFVVMSKSHPGVIIPGCSGYYKNPFQPLFNAFPGRHLHLRYSHQIADGNIISPNYNRSISAIRNELRATLLSILPVSARYDDIIEVVGTDSPAFLTSRGYFITDENVQLIQPANKKFDKTEPIKISDIIYSKNFPAVYKAKSGTIRLGKILIKPLLTLDGSKKCNAYVWHGNYIGEIIDFLKNASPDRGINTSNDIVNFLAGKTDVCKSAEIMLWHYNL